MLQLGAILESMLVILVHRGTIYAISVINDDEEYDAIYYNSGIRSRYIILVY